MYVLIVYSLVRTLGDGIAIESSGGHVAEKDWWWGEGNIKIQNDFCWIFSNVT